MTMLDDLYAIGNEMIPMKLLVRDIKGRYQYPIGKRFTGSTIGNGFIRHWKEGRPHKDIGPAVVHQDGYQEYWINGKKHRKNLPAVIFSDLSEEWYHRGKLHRTDGPAIDDTRGYKEWWLNGNEYNDINEWAKAVGIHNTEEFVLMKLEHG